MSGSGHRKPEALWKVAASTLCSSADLPAPQAVAEATPGPARTALAAYP
jgi:hypothetical protein